MEELSLDNILTGEEIEDLFTSTEDIREAEDVSTPDKKKQELETTEVDPEDLFMEELESVGSEDNNKGKEDTTSKEDNTSPNFYSSIANALVEDGIFQNLDEESLSNIQSAEDFANVISEQIKSQFDERQKRIDEALNLGVEPSEIQKYERFINFLDSVTEESISNENEEGENLRKNIIFQDYINRGFSKERASREVERSFKAGTDIEDAKEALQSNLDYYKEQYSIVVKEAREADKKEQARLKKQAEDLRTSILNEDKAFGEIDIDKATRQRVYDSIMKPVYTDPETGEKLTAIQKYESENKTDFLKNIGLVYVLTDGFKKLDGLVQGRVKKEMKKGLRELEHTLNGTSRNNGNIRFVSGVGGDFDSKSTKWDIDI
jgi:hypothetical protein